ncbi:hypothetical protein [Psychromonas ossibalaenae]|uniref:hypothetical protein n=1 Tax=Psychromonas ossibalaenae TaxID=444922 RepID=UPI00036DA67B|nr:hypothetical protein [Psychromonas ossibalaenae]
MKILLCCSVCASMREAMEKDEVQKVASEMNILAYSINPMGYAIQDGLKILNYAKEMVAG